MSMVGAKVGKTLKVDCFCQWALQSVPKLSELEGTVIINKKYQNSASFTITYTQYLYERKETFLYEPYQFGSAKGRSC